MALVVQEAARDQLGCGDRFAGLDAHGDHGDEDAVARELLALAQHDVLGAADLQAVDEHHAGRHLAGDGRALRVDLEHVAVVEDEDVVVGDADLRAPARRAGTGDGTRRAPARSSAA